MANSVTRTPEPEVKDISDIEENLTSAELKEKHDEYLFPSVINYYSEAIALESGKGCYLKDVEGKEYLDFFGGILTVSIGHSDDRINKAISTQMNRLGHVSTLYPTIPIVELAER